MYFELLGHRNLEVQSAQKILQLPKDVCGLCSHTYFGVNPRIGGKGKKENVHFLTAFHAEVDYGKVGHKKPNTIDLVLSIFKKNYL